MGPWDEQCHTLPFVLGKGGCKDGTILNYFTYLRSVLIIKQYVDSMCFPSSLAKKYKLYFIYVK